MQRAGRSLLLKRIPMKKEIKVCFIIASLLLGFYLWGEYSAFKLMKNESGQSWSASGSQYGGVHHK